LAGVAVLNEMLNPRKLDATLDERGRIVSFKCSACNWTKVPDNPHMGPTRHTLAVYEAHICADHQPGGEKKLLSQFSFEMLAFPILLPA